MSGRKYFGTDGVRGRVGEFPITPDFVMKLGWAAGRVLGGEKGGTVLIGKDTRVSGYMFESALEAGLSAAGVDILLLGPMPTPAIAYLTQTLHASAGIVISASHNAYTDNGIKFFSGSGMKLPDDVELEIERYLDLPMETVEPQSLGKAERLDDAAGRYIEFCKSSIPFWMDFRGLKVVVDCAHGATYHVAPNILRELGADVITIGASPDGFNINEGCGSTVPEALQGAVQANGADVGISLDGDGDRVIMVDHKAEVVDGDEILYVIAENRHQRGTLNGVVVGTLMTNLGLEQALGRLGVQLKRAKIGDRYVIEMMNDGDCTLGGETSGHIICFDRQTTGDGITAALQVLAAMRSSEKSLHDLKQGMTKHPQVLINVKTRERLTPDALGCVDNAVSDAESVLGNAGRVLLRPSGTEPLVRVMVEGQDPKQVRTVAETLAKRVESSLGVSAN